jgi:hypothetical protein
MARVRWDRVGRIGLLVVLAVVSVLYIEDIISVVGTKVQDGHQLAIVRGLVTDNSRLSQEQRSLSRPATITADARKLGMVKVGEHPYVVTGQPGN